MKQVHIFAILIGIFILMVGIVLYKERQYTHPLQQTQRVVNSDVNGYFKIQTIEFRGKKHEYVIRDFGIMDQATFAMCHYPDCEYCKSKK